MFAHQIGRNIQVYIDEMLMKSLREDGHLGDLQENFNTFWVYNMKLNPNKCVRSNCGKILGIHGILKGYRG